MSRDGDSTQRWRKKSLQHCSQLYGGLKAQVMREMELHSQDNLSLASTETPPPLYLRPRHPSNHSRGMQRVGRAGTPQRAGSHSRLTSDVCQCCTNTSNSSYFKLTHPSHCFHCEASGANSRFGKFLKCMFPFLHVQAVHAKVL